MRKNHHNQGFTLIEMLVSISLFVIVAFIIVTTFISITEAYRKSQAMRLVIDNVNFAMDSITLRLRDGGDYKCGTPLDTCSSEAGKGITFTTTDQRTMYYRWVTENPGHFYLAQCVATSGSNCSNPASYREVTSPDVNLTDVRFYVYSPPADIESPEGVYSSRVILSLTGEAKVGRQTSVFTLQTTITERP